MKIVIRGLGEVGTHLANQLSREEHDLSLVESAVIATFNNMGPGFDLVGPTQNFSWFQPHTKLLFSFLMLLGRLEIYALVVLFLPSFWKRF
jgi:trk system potassium uptake protein TrkH